MGAPWESDPCVPPPQWSWHARLPQTHHIFGIWLHGYGPVDFLPPPDSEVVFQVEDGLLPVGVGSIGGWWGTQEREEERGRYEQESAEAQDPHRRLELSMAKGSSRPKNGKHGLEHGKHGSARSCLSPIPSALLNH